MRDRQMKDKPPTGIQKTRRKECVCVGVLNLEVGRNIEDTSNLPWLTHVEFMSVVLDFTVNDVERTGEQEAC